MTPVDQTEFSNRDVEPATYGNCLSACLASITGIPIADIPNFATIYAETGSWWPEFRKFLSNNQLRFFGMFYFPQNGDWNSLLARRSGIDGYFICGGSSPRDTIGGHSVIYKDGVMVHDPHPSRDGLKVLEDAYMIERLA